MRGSHKLALLGIAVLAAVVSVAVWAVRASPTAGKPLESGSGSAVVTGKVLNIDDKPQQDIVVQLLPPMMPGKPAGGGASPTYKARTDKDGQFRIEKVQAGSYRLLAGDKVIGMATKELTVAADQTLTLEVKLRKPKK